MNSMFKRCVGEVCLSVMLDEVVNVVPSERSGRLRRVPGSERSDFRQAGVSNELDPVFVKLHYRQQANVVVRVVPISRSKDAVRPEDSLPLSLDFRAGEDDEVSNTPP